MLRVKNIDHIAICVEDLARAKTPYQDVLGLASRPEETSAELATAALMFPLGESSIELIAPHGDNPGLRKFLDKRGPGLHHIALRVEDLKAGLEFLKGLGVPLLDEEPRAGAHGSKVAFLHPKATGGILIELVEK